MPFARASPGRSSPGRSSTRPASIRLSSSRPSSVRRSTHPQVTIDQNGIATCKASWEMPTNQEAVSATVKHALTDDSDSESDQEQGSDARKKKKKRGVWIASNFHKKDCTKYIPRPNASKKACYCGRLKRQHSKGAQNVEVMESVTDEESQDPHGVLQEIIQEFPTDSYGEIQFGQAEGINNRAKYVRLSDNTDPALILELLMYYWKLSKPRLILSITGGGNHFKLNKQDQDTFSRGISKAAQTTDAWIITSGFNAGVPKIVGQTMKESQTMRWFSQGLEAADQGICCIGITPWGYVSGTDPLVGKNEKGCYPARYKLNNTITRRKPMPLNQNHSHFIFVDNGMRNEAAFGGEILMRSKIEGAIKAATTESGLGLPVILLVLEGGPDAILNVKSSINQGIPTVVCDGTGRAADILAYAHLHSKENEDGVRVVQESNLVILQEKIKISFGLEPDTEVMSIMLQNISACVKNQSLITVFEMDEGENNELDLAILTALLKGQAATPFYQLSLALSWDRVDVAQKYICTDEVNWPPGSLDAFLTQAISANQVGFVELFLEQGIVMKDYLTVGRLRHLYNMVEDTQFFRRLLVRARGEGRFSDDIYLHDVSLLLKQLLGNHDSTLYDFDLQRSGIHTETLAFAILATSLSGTTVIQKSYQEYLKSQRKKFTTGSGSLGVAELANPGMHFARPFSELFLWALLMDRVTMAEFFWQQIENPILAAIMASCILNKISQLTPELNAKAEYTENAKKFEGLATDVLDKCYKTDGKLAEMLLDQPVEHMGKGTVLSMAADAEDKRFISHPCCQSLIDNIWNGGVHSRGWKIIVGILCPFFILSSINFFPAENGSELRPGKKLKTFYQAPVTKFWCGVISYSLLVLLYSFVILSRFDQEPTVVEHVLSAWILILILDEIRQAVIEGEDEDSMTLRFTTWLSSEWNILDALILTCTAIGLILHNVDVDLRITSAFLAVACFLLYTRMLHICTISPYLGPLLVMIRKMIKEMLGFIFILCVFLIGFGVSSMLLKHPKEPFSTTTIINVVYQPYFHIYGELFLDGTPGEDCGMSSDDQYCSETHPLLPIMLAVYLMLGNVLLLNLLIAIFSAVFEEVQENSLEIWKFELYTLVVESSQLPILPGPLVIFKHLYDVCCWIGRKCQRCCKQKKKKKDKPLYSKKQKRMLKLFEKECAAVFRKKRAEKHSAEITERIKRLDKTLETLSKNFELTSLELTKQLQNLNKNFTQGGVLQGQMTQGQHNLQTVHGPNANLVPSTTASSMPLEVGKGHVQIHSLQGIGQSQSIGSQGQILSLNNTNGDTTIKPDVAKVKDYDTISESSGNGDEKKKKNRSKKRTAKVNPETHISTVDSSISSSKWAVCTQPGTAISSSVPSTASADRPLDVTGETARTSSNPKLTNRQSVTIDHLLFMDTMIQESSDRDNESHCSGEQLAQKRPPSHNMDLIDKDDTPKMVNNNDSPSNPFPTRGGSHIDSNKTSSTTQLLMDTIPPTDGSLIVDSDESAIIHSELSALSAGVIAVKPAPKPNESSSHKSNMAMSSSALIAQVEIGNPGAVDDTQPLIGQARNKRRVPKKMSISVDDFLNSVT